MPFLSIDSPLHLKGEVTFDTYLCDVLSIVALKNGTETILEAKDLNQHRVPRETKQTVLILTNCCNASGLLPSGSFINWDIMRQ